MHRLTRPLALALLGAALLAGCGSAEREEGETSPEAGAVDTQTAPYPTATAVTGESSGGVAAIAQAISEDLSKQPEIPAGEGQPPNELVKRDIVTGDGRTAEPGDTVTVQYVGALYDNGQQFDASWDRGEPFTFELGAGQVIPGWDEGVAGMKVGGRRLLVIPPDQAYGEQGAPPDIPPNSTLSFVVDLEKVEKGS